MAKTPDYLKFRRFFYYHQNLITFGSAYIAVIREIGEVNLHVGMADRLFAFVGLQITLGDIGLHVAAVDENVIPRPVLGRAGTRRALIPGIAAIELGVDVDDHTAIIEAFVVNQLPNAELCRREWHFFEPLCTSQPTPALPIRDAGVGAPLTFWVVFLL